MKIRTVAIIQARMRSTRLPGKVLLSILGRPMLELMVERLRRASALDDIVIATSQDPSCAPIGELADRLGIRCFRGSEEDVLGRVLAAGRAAGADVLVRTTGDCPLIDPLVVSRVVETFLGSGVDYCSNTLERTYPRGMDVEVFPLQVLQEVGQLTQDPADREHVSLYIYQHPERFRLLNVASGLPPEATELRLTVDTPKDFALVTAIYEKLYPTKPHFSLTDILAVFVQYPELRNINRTVVQKAVR